MKNIFKNLQSLLSEKPDGNYRYNLNGEILKTALDEDIFSQIEGSLGDKISSLISKDIYKGIRDEILTNKKFRKEMLNKVILKMVKYNQDEIKELLKR